MLVIHSMSGRLTGLNGTAISGAMVELTQENVSTRSDADGRFMLMTTVPPDQTVALLVTAQSGASLTRYIRLAGRTSALSMPAHLDAFVADMSHEGQRVWRSSFSLQMTA
jgi:hypothetical protein